VESSTVVLAPVWESTVVHVEERRLNSRVSVPYSGRLWGVDVDGRAVREDARLDNLSAAGLYMRLKRRLLRGSGVSVAVRLARDPIERIPALRLAARGVVVRTEPQPDGTCGVAVKFTRHRVL
jgi:hypothetical protein